MAQIRIEKLHKAFGDFVAVRESTITIADREFFVMLGPSGCGKTTTLRMIAGLEIPTSGHVFLGGDEVTGLRPAKRDIAFVFQLYALYPHMNVRANVGYPLRSQGVSRKETRERVEAVAEMLRIGHLLNKPVSSLSGGDRQRVALGRAIVRRPRAFLMDEPLGALDSEFRALMREEVRRLHDRIGSTTVYVTHDQIEAMSMADRIAVMNHGAIEHVGTPDEIYHRPRNKFVAEFVGSPSMNFLPARGPLEPGATSAAIDGAVLDIPELHEGLDHSQAAIGARPEHIYVSDHGDLRGTIFGVEYMGACQLLTIDTAAGRLRVRSPNAVKVDPGETVGLGFRSEALVVFDERTQRALDSELMRRTSDG